MTSTVDVDSLNTDIIKTVILRSMARALDSQSIHLKAQHFRINAALNKTRTILRLQSEK